MSKPAWASQLVVSPLFAPSSDSSATVPPSHAVAVPDHFPYQATWRRTSINLHDPDKVTVTTLTNFGLGPTRMIIMA